MLEFKKVTKSFEGTPVLESLSLKIRDNESVAKAIAKEVGIDCALIHVGYAQEGEIERCAPTYEWQGIEDMVKGLL